MTSRLVDRLLELLLQASRRLPVKTLGKSISSAGIRRETRSRARGEMIINETVMFMGCEDLVARLDHATVQQLLHMLKLKSNRNFDDDAILMQYIHDAGLAAVLQSLNWESKKHLIRVSGMKIAATTKKHMDDLITEEALLRGTRWFFHDMSEAMRLKWCNAIDGDMDVNDCEDLPLKMVCTVFKLHDHVAQRTDDNGDDEHCENSATVSKRGRSVEESADQSKRTQKRPRESPVKEEPGELGEEEEERKDVESPVKFGNPGICTQANERAQSVKPESDANVKRGTMDRVVTPVRDAWKSQCRGGSRKADEIDASVPFDELLSHWTVVELQKYIEKHRVPLMVVTGRVGAKLTKHQLCQSLYEHLHPPDEYSGSEEEEDQDDTASPNEDLSPNCRTANSSEIADLDDDLVMIDDEEVIEDGYLQ